MLSLRVYPVGMQVGCELAPLRSTGKWSSCHG
eukprot:COSAG05_NODE_392_length_10391_cov_8.232899_5_plen_32_part_00